jgi:hypothetical protein
VQLIESRPASQIDVELIALTADESPEMREAVATYPFKFQCSRLSRELILKLISKLSGKQQQAP